MKKIFGWVALLVGMVTGANAQVNDTIQRTTGNDLYQGITRKLPYRQMVTPHGVQVTFAKTVHIIFPSAVRYVDLGSDRIIAGRPPRVFRGKRTFPLSARTGASIRSMPGMRMSRRC